RSGYLRIWPTLGPSCPHQEDVERVYAPLKAKGVAGIAVHVQAQHSIVMKESSLDRVGLRVRRELKAAGKSRPVGECNAGLDTQRCSTADFILRDRNTTPRCAATRDVEGHGTDACDPASFHLRWRDARPAPFDLLWREDRLAGGHTGDTNAEKYQG